MSIEASGRDRRGTAGSRLPVRLHRTAVRAYPRRFRDRFGASLEADFERALADRAAGRTGAWGVTLSWCGDALFSGIMERWGRGGGEIRMRERSGGDGANVGRWGSGGRDVKLALRRLRRQPGLAAVVMLTLGLAIGAASTVFLAVEVLFLRALPYPSAERLHRLEAGANGRFDPRIAIADAEDVASIARSIESLAMIDFGTVSISDGSGAADVAVSAHASASIFDVLGIKPVLGRGFAAGEDEPGRGDVVVLSDAFWRRQYAADPGAIGREIRIQGRPHSIVGVLPADFEDPTSGEEGYADVWLPLAVDATLRQRGTRWARAIVRLGADARAEEAGAEISSIAGRLAQLHPETNEDQTFRLVPLREAIWGDARTPLMLMLLATLAVVTIACTNLANLFLARATLRRPEIAVQRALGASTPALVRQMLLESVFLGMAGGAVGLMLTYGASALTRYELGSRLPRLASAAPNLSVLAFACALSLLAAMGFGLAPSLRAIRTDPASALGSARGTGRPRIRRAARRMLVAAQVTLSVVLLVSAAILLTHLQRLARTDPGFVAPGVLAFDLSLPAVDYADGSRIIALHEQIAERFETMPGVVSAGAVDKPPLGTRWGCNAFAIDGRPLPDQPSAWPCADTRSITKDYTATMEIPLLRGRLFGEADDTRAPQVVLINEALANRLWPDEDPIGKRIAWPQELEDENPWRTIVGVIGDVRHRGPMVEAPAEVYMPLAQAPDRRMTWLVRTAQDPLAMVPTIRTMVLALDPNLPVRRPRAMEDELNRTLGSIRASGLATVGLAAFALMLALVGLYGVLSFLVARRTSEFGVRLAFGASRRDLERHVMREGMVTVAVAALVGFGMAWGVQRALRGVLDGLTSPAPMVLATIGLAVLGTAAIACWIPARRAARLDPAQALLSD